MENSSTWLYQFIIIPQSVKRIKLTDIMTMKMVKCSFVWIKLNEEIEEYLTVLSLFQNGSHCNSFFPMIPS